MRLKFQNNKKMAHDDLLHDYQFFGFPRSDVSLLAATVGIKSYQWGKKQVISIGHMVCINKINEVERVPFKLFYCILMTF